MDEMYKLWEFNSSHQKMEALHNAMADSFTTMAAEQSGSFLSYNPFQKTL
jgi:hypothetical protein